MDIQEYIASGILETYAMGAASEQERREVECLTSIYPSLKDELTKIQEVIESYSKSLAISPSEELREKILEAIKNLPQETEALKAIVPVDQIKAEKKETKVRIMNSYVKVAAAAAILLLIGIGYAYNQVKGDYAELEEEMLTAQEQSDQLLQYLKDSLEINIDERSFLLDQNTETILLAGTDISPDTKVRLFWNKESEEYALHYDQLPKAVDGKQYQLWAIAAGQPVSLGVLDKSEEYLMKLALQLNDIQAFAITLEQEGGSIEPTLEAMYVLGSV